MLEGQVQLDDANLGGERSGGKVGRGSENKVPFVAAVSLSDEGHPLRVKLTPVAGFTLAAIEDWARGHLAPGATVLSDGLACFSAVTKAGCAHQPTVVAQRKQLVRRVSQRRKGGEFAFVRSARVRPLDMQRDCVVELFLVHHERRSASCRAIAAPS